MGRPDVETKVSLATLSFLLRVFFVSKSLPLADFFQSHCTPKHKNVITFVIIPTIIFIKYLIAFISFTLPESRLTAFSSASPATKGQLGGSDAWEKNAMTTPEFFTSAFAIAGLAAVATLGSQLITARANWKNKRLELTYARKTEAYQNFLTEVTQIVHDQRVEEEQYRAYLKVLSLARLVASPEVYKALGPLALDGAVQELRRVGLGDYNKRLQVVETILLNYLQDAQSTMRRDLDRLGGL